MLKSSFINFYKEMYGFVQFLKSIVALIYKICFGYATCVLHSTRGSNKIISLV
jgi:hypothetical protein